MKGSFSTSQACTEISGFSICNNFVSRSLRLSTTRCSELKCPISIRARFFSSVLLASWYRTSPVIKTCAPDAKNRSSRLEPLPQQTATRLTGNSGEPNHSNRFQVEGLFEVTAERCQNRFGNVSLQFDPVRFPSSAEDDDVVLTASNTDTFFRPMCDTRISLRPSAALSRFVCAENIESRFRMAKSMIRPKGCAHINRFNRSEDKRVMRDEHVGRFFDSVFKYLQRRIEGQP